MSFDFDKIIDRKNTNSLKFDFAVERGKPEEILPMWVADMDFQTPIEVTNALVKVAEHGIFGYSEAKAPYFESVKNWFLVRHNFIIDQEWIVMSPGIVFALAQAVKAYTKESDGVLIQRPVYYPFSEVVIENNRRLINNPLIFENGKYTIDFDDFEKKIKENDVKLFLLCSPHNPVGRVWTKDELEKMGQICLKNGVVVVSDEIHADFVYPGHQHVVFTDVNDSFKENTLIMTAPSKTFNLAGLWISNIVIPSKTLRNKFSKELVKNGISQLGIMGITAAQAAYEYGSQWLDELLVYLKSNIDYVRDYLEENLPKVKLIEPEGTYLLWLDFRSYNLSQSKLEELVVNRAGLWLDSGTMFGSEGKGFQRINIATNRSTVQSAMEKLKYAFED
jgi:cystathionine beta-lyase